VNGVTIHVVEAGPPDAPLVLLLHGFPEAWFAWRKIMQPLADAGLRVWAPDQRGYNLSDKPKGALAYNLDTLSDDAVGLIEAAGVESAAVVGHDWGASVAWWTASRRPERVARLVAINAPHPVVWKDQMARNEEQRGRSTYVRFFETARLPEIVLGAGRGAALARNLRQTAGPSAFSDADMTELRDSWSQPGALTAMINWYRGNKTLPPLTDPQVESPALILWGEQDRFAVRETALASAALCDSAKTVFFPQATHWLHREQPEEVAGQILAFLNSG
jgi:pimeloyl-ACP methyl ester carboxylesterase